MSKKISLESVEFAINKIAKYFPDEKEFKLGWAIIKMMDFKKIGIKSKDIKRRYKSIINKKRKEFVRQFKKSDFGTIHISELYKKKFGNNEWIVESLIPRHGVTIISGIPGSYKSYISLHIAQCASSGLKVFNRFNTTKINVLIIDEEEHESILQKRIRQMKIDKKSGVFFRVLKGFTTSNEDQMNGLLEFIAKKKIKLVIFDSFRKILKGNENDSEAVNEVHLNYKKIVAGGASVITLHHHRKSQQGQNKDDDYDEEIRGSTDILGSAECHLKIKSKKSILTIYQKKLRIAKALEPFSVEVVGDENNIGFQFLSDKVIENKSDLAKELILSLLNEAENKSLTRKEVIEMLKKKDVGTNNVDTAIDELRAESRIELLTGRSNSKTLILVNDSEAM